MMCLNQRLNVSHAVNFDELRHLSQRGKCSYLWSTSVQMITLINLLQKSSFNQEFQPNPPKPLNQ